MKIEDQILDVGDDVYYSDGFKAVIEHHLPYLKNQLSTIHTLDNTSTAKYRGDFYGALDSLGVPKQYHYVHLRVNELRSPIEFVGQNRILLVRNNVVDAMLKRHTARMKKLIA